MITNYWSGFLRTVLAQIKQCLIAFIIYNQLSSNRSCSYGPWYDLKKSVLTQMSGSFPLKSGAEPLTYFASPAPVSISEPGLCSPFLLLLMLTSNFTAPGVESSGSSGALVGQLSAALSEVGFTFWDSPTTPFDPLNTLNCPIVLRRNVAHLALLPRLFPFVLGAPSELKPWTLHTVRSICH